MIDTSLEDNNTTDTTEVAVATGDSTLPSYMRRKGPSRGNENVGAEVAIPRLKQLQKMSDEVDKHHPNYIDGADPGDFMNTITRKLYGSEIFVISVLFSHKYIVWKKRDFGSALLGYYETHLDAEKAIEECEKPEQYDIVETHTHLLMVKDPATGNLEKTPVMMDFANTKLRTSKQWNSNIAIQGGDRFAGVWKLSSESKTSKAGHAYMVLDLEFAGWATEEDYKLAEGLYEQTGGNMPVAG